MRASEPQTQTDFELERYIIEHRDPRDEAAPAAAPHTALLAMRYLFENGHLHTCGFTAEQAAGLTMDGLADIQARALRATLAAMQSADRTAKAIGGPRPS